MMPHSRKVAGLAMLLLSGLWLTATGQDNGEVILQGIYTADQALRGRELYLANCSSCHSTDLRGNSNAPSLVGLSFTFIWEGRSVGEFFTTIRELMPTDRPASLPVSSYADILAFILSSNGYPAGNAELSADVDYLSGVTITAPP